MNQLNVQPIGIRDGDSSWAEFSGAVRVRYAGPGVPLLLQVSVPDGAGQFDVSTFSIPGASLRDTRHSATEFPSYGPQNSLADVPTTSSRDAAQQLADTGTVPGGDGPPISAASRKADGFAPNT